MENFKKGFMTTLGVLAGLSIYATVSSLFGGKSDKKGEKEAEKTE